jgi:hypothetical protein
MKCFYAACLFLLTLPSNAQVSQLSLSEDFKVVNHEYRDQTISNAVYHNNGFYTVTNSGMGVGKWLFTKLYDVKLEVTLTRFDRNMKEVKEIKLSNGAKEFGPLLPSLFLMQNKLVLVYFKSENKSSFDLYMSKVNETTLEVTDTKKICTFQQENVGLFKIESVISGGLVFISNSTDGDKTLLACKTSSNKLQTFIIDQQLEVVRGSEMTLNTPDAIVSSAVLTKDNLECMLISSELDTKLMYVGPDGKKGQRNLPVNAVQKLYAPKLQLAKNGKSIWLYAATTATGKSDESSNGLQLIQFDCTTQQLSKPLVYRFSAEMLDLIAQREGKTERRSRDYRYYFRPQLLELKNNQTVLVGSPEMIEQSSYTVTDGSRSQTTVKTAFNVGPVIAFFPGQSGADLSYTLIPRKILLSKSNSSGTGAVTFLQVSGISNSSSSFVAKAVENRIIVVYNDNEENLSRELDQKVIKTHSAKNLLLAEAVISDNRSIAHRTQLGENMKGVTTYYLGNAVQNSTGDFVFPVGKEGVGYTKQVFTNWCFIN